MLNKIYSWAANFLLGKILGGNKTLVLGWICTFIGAWNIIVTQEMLDNLCTIGLCLGTNKVFGIIITIIGEATKILRFATGQKYGDLKYIK